MKPTIESIPLMPLKKDKRGAVYDCDGFFYVERKKGSVTADHIHKEGETIYLLRGKIEVTIGKASKKIGSPAKFMVPPKAYHKIVALSDIIFIKTGYG